MALGQLHIHVGKSKLEKKKTSKPWSGVTLGPGPLAHVVVWDVLP